MADTTLTPAAATSGSGRVLDLPGLASGEPDERDRLIARARETDAARQLQRCFPRWLRALEHLSWRALVRLAGNEPIDPNDRGAWESRDAHAKAVLRRHGLTHQNVARLSLAAITGLIDGQAAADRDAGLDWGTITIPASRLDERVRRAHGTLPLDLSDPPSTSTATTSVAPSPSGWNRQRAPNVGFQRRVDHFIVGKQESDDGRCRLLRFVQSGHVVGLLPGFRNHCASSTDATGPRDRRLCHAVTTQLQRASRTAPPSSPSRCTPSMAGSLRVANCETSWVGRPDPALAFLGACRRFRSQRVTAHNSGISFRAGDAPALVYDRWLVSLMMVRS